MTVEQFGISLSLSAPPATFPVLVQALWYEAKGNWERAHQIAQEQEGDPAYDRIHAYLHRVEGDSWNAAYWYRRLGIAVPTVSFDEERSVLVQELLA